MIGAVDTEQTLLALKIGFLVLLYLFIWAVVRSVSRDLRVADGNASRRHAEVMQEGATYLVIDLGSTNGTELNGKRITREKLTDGDRITIGATDLVFGRALP